LVYANSQFQGQACASLSERSNIHKWQCLDRREIETKPKKEGGWLVVIIFNQRMPKKKTNRDACRDEEANRKEPSLSAVVVVMSFLNVTEKNNECSLW